MADLYHFSTKEDSYASHFIKVSPHTLLSMNVSCGSSQLSLVASEQGKALSPASAGVHCGLVPPLAPTLNRAACLVMPPLQFALYMVL